jgi:hypothetical protein
MILPKASLALAGSVRYAANYDRETFKVQATALHQPSLLLSCNVAP